jgi:ZIP family zinc transporter
MDLLLIIFILVVGPILGSLIGVSFNPSKRFLYYMLSFSGGVMIAISMLELVPESIRISSVPIAIIGILIGTVIMFIFGKFISNVHPKDDCKCEPGLFKSAILIITGIFIHNIPEGLAVAIGTLSENGVTLFLAIAIAFHDIPESICTSVPYYFCTKNRLKTFLVSVSVILPTLLGFFLGYFFYKIISPNMVGLVTAITAGSMIYISADELIPSSCSKVSNHHTIISFMVGVVFVIFLDMII